MPPIEQVLRDRILSNPTVSGLIHGTISPQILPENAPYPAVTYNRVSTDRDRLLIGSAVLVESRFQVSVFDPSYATVRLVASGIRMQLDGQQATTLVNEYDLFDEAARAHYAVMDFNVIYDEEPPEASTSIAPDLVSTYGTVVASGGAFSHTLTISGVPVSIGPSGGLNNIVEDLTPQLGGDLDVNGKRITAANNGAITISGSSIDVVSTGTPGQTYTATGDGGITFNANGVADLNFFTATSNMAIGAGGSIAAGAVGSVEFAGNAGLFLHEDAGNFVNIFSSEPGGTVNIDADDDITMTSAVGNVAIAGAGNGVTDGIDLTALGTFGSINQNATSTLGFSIATVSKISVNSTQVTATVPFIAPNATAAAPGFAFSSDSDCGMFRSAANVIGLSAGGVVRVTISGANATTSGIGVAGNITGRRLSATELVAPLTSAANDAAAATAGVPINGLYHTSGTVKIRLT